MWQERCLPCAPSHINGSRGHGAVRGRTWGSERKDRMHYEAHIALPSSSKHTRKLRGTEALPASQNQTAIRIRKDL